MPGKSKNLRHVYLSSITIQLMECLRLTSVWVKLIFNKIKEYVLFAYSYIKFVLPFVLVYLIHIISSNLYANLCANLSFVGFVNSLFLIGSPICSMILQIVTHTNTAFIAIISGLCILVIGYVPRNLENSRPAERPTERVVGRIY